MPLPSDVPRGAGQPPARRCFRRSLLGAVLLGAGLCFALGYRLPWGDRHPDWPAFPCTTNPRLVVEYIGDEEFERRYAWRFPQVQARQRADRWDFADVYRTNLRNVHSLGFRATDNRFEPDLSERWRLHWPGANGGNEVDRPSPRVGFYQKGYEYFELTLAADTARCKVLAFSDRTEQVNFFQYNAPSSPSDTLYFYYFFGHWRLLHR
ncbi:hypothetical protein JAO73_09830 [Hymenobacter sp. BT523]|uniref:hypothetical protein n=1 Tax=Hymenobacter sp. BT523 TaxID=2795725 RepID=UPI0018EC4EA9|nr:hypothetical protein [Hymenobacter sp. BT523]MBJ6109312.1 hypothetical protein [Hymenobacter sp. BT523]